jgi:hypothetical protein
MVKALKAFRTYVLHSKITAYVPTSSVKDILVQPDNDRKRGRWLAKIQEFDLEIKPTKLIKGQVIQVDIGGHPPFPTGSKQFSGNFGNLLFLAGFNFRGHFEGLNEGFLRSRFSMISKGILSPQNESPRRYLSNELSHA